MCKHGLVHNQYFVNKVQLISDVAVNDISRFFFSSNIFVCNVTSCFSALLFVPITLCQIYLLLLYYFVWVSTLKNPSNTLQLRVKVYTSIVFFFFNGIKENALQHNKSATKQRKKVNNPKSKAKFTGNFPYLILGLFLSLFIY